MGQTGDTHQVGEILGLSVKKHLHGKVRTELRHAQGPQGTAADIVRHDSQSGRVLEQAHDLPAVQGNVLYRVNTDQILKHTYHGGIIVSQYIQLQQVVVNGMVVKMGGDRGGGHIVGRVLHRGKGIDFLAQRKHDNASGVLSRCPSHSHAALHNAVNLAVSFPGSPFLIIFLYISEGRLVRQGAYGSRAEGLTLSKDNLRIIMGLALVFTGEVKVDIRLLVSLKSQEGLKGDVKPVLFQRCAAHRAFLVRHIASGHAGELLHFFGIKVIVTALGAMVMGAQRVYLGDSGHGSHKGGTHGTTGTHQVSVLIGLPHQLLGNDVHNRESVGDNGMKLPLQAVHYDFRQVLPVHLMSPVITDLGQRLIGILDDRRTLVRPHRGNLLTHIGNLPGVGDHHLMGLIRSQVGKFLQHLLCCPEIQGRLIVRILKSLASHDDSAVYLVLGIQEVDIAGSADQLVKLHSQFHYLFIYLD